MLNQIRVSSRVRANNLGRKDFRSRQSGYYVSVNAAVRYQKVALHVLLTSLDSIEAFFDSHSVRPESRWFCDMQANPENLGKIKRQPD
jgi:hypothetical protein